MDLVKGVIKTAKRRMQNPSGVEEKEEYEAEATHEVYVNKEQNESLDYHTMYNSLRLEEQKNTRARKWQLESVFRWLMALLVGLIVAFVAFSLHFCTEKIFSSKFDLANRYLAEHKTGAAFGTFLTINLVLAIFGSYIISFWVPPAGGAGTTEVVAYLNGNRLYSAISIKTFLWKLITSICHVASSLPVGPEGPMIMLGGIVGGSFAQSYSKTLGVRIPFLTAFHNDKDRRDFISIGAACGVAAAFNAPIGGILFSLEECSSFWSATLTAQSFLGAMVAVFFANYLIHANELKHSAQDWQASFGAQVYSSVTFVDLVISSLIGIFGGLLGALFVKISALCFKLRKKFIVKYKFRRVLEVAWWTLFMSSLLFCIPLAASCRERPASHTIAGSSSSCTDDGSTAIESSFMEESRWTCRVAEVAPPGQSIIDIGTGDSNPDTGGGSISNTTVGNQTATAGNSTSDELMGSYNPYAGIFFTASPDQLKRFFVSETWNDFSGWLLFLFLVVFFFMTCIIAGSALSGGLLVPSLVIGASMGRLVIFLLDRMAPSAHFDDKVSIYAIVGAAAFLAGSSRLKISLTVIMLEITHSLNTLPTLMLAVMFANWVGDYFGHSLQHKQLHLRGITFLDPEPAPALEKLHVKHLMSGDIKYFPLKPTVQAVIKTLMSCDHNGFPVVDVGSSGEERKLKGLILRSQLVVLLKMRVWNNQDVPMTYGEMALQMAHLRVGPNKPSTIRLTGADEASQIDLEPYMNESPCTVHLRFSAFLAFRVFRGLGLRHLPVVDNDNQVVGILTRKDMFNPIVGVVAEWEEKNRLSRRPSVIA